VSVASTGPPPGLRQLNVTLPLRAYVATLWQRRDFAVSMAAGDVRAKHANTILGSIWYLLNPLLLLSVYYLVFGLLLRVDRGVTNFIGFLAAGIFVFQFSQRAVTGGARSISGNLSLIRSLQFPRALLPLAAVLREAYSVRAAMVVAVVILLASGETFTPWSLLVVPVLGLQFMFNLGGAFVTARLADKVKDIENVLPFLFRLAFYGSGVLFLVDRIIDELGRPELKVLFVINPLYCFISLTRDYLMSTIDQQDVGLMWVSAIVWSVGLLIAGLLYFRAGEQTYGRG
jgi:teichoic acid transport system permease protein